MENTTTGVEDTGTDGLLVAKRRITEARGRAEVPSDVSGGRSDGNEN